MIFKIHKHSIRNILSTPLIKDEDCLGIDEDLVFNNELFDLSKYDDWTMDVYVPVKCIPMLVNHKYIEYKIKYIPDSGDPTLIIEEFRLTLRGRWALFLYRIKNGWHIQNKKLSTGIVLENDYYMFYI